MDRGIILPVIMLFLSMICLFISWLLCIIDAFQHKTLNWVVLMLFIPVAYFFYFKQFSDGERKTKARNFLLIGIVLLAGGIIITLSESATDKAKEITPP